MSISMKQILRSLLPVLVVAVAILGAVILFKTRPIPKPKEVEEYATLVRVQPLEKSRQTVRLNTTGTVVPESQIALQSRVSGEVVWMNPSFIPAAGCRKGRPC